MEQNQNKNKNKPKNTRRKSLDKKKTTIEDEILKEEEEERKFDFIFEKNKKYKIIPVIFKINRETNIKDLNFFSPILKKLDNDSSDNTILTIGLFVGPYFLIWDSTSLIIPKRVSFYNF
jgi:hypothetical protein